MSSLTACTSGTIGTGAPKADLQATTTDESSNNLCGQLTSPLTEQEQEYATVAWQYFVNNRQPETGFTNSADKFPSGTLWDQGNYLMALNAVRWMGIIDQDEFDLQLNQFLTSLGELPLVEGALPNKVYNSATGEMVDYSNQPTEKGLGWSALDIGRFLTSLHIIRTCHPQYDNWISGLMASWQLPRSIEDGQLYGAIYESDGKLLPVQEGRLGYEEYAVRGYELWGLKAPKALEADPMKLVEVSGVKIPVDQRNFQDTDANNYVVSESYILEAIEFGWDDNLEKSAQAVLAAQENRYKETGHLTAVSEDNVDQAPHFLYSTLYANGTPWAVITEENEPHPELRTLSTKSAFGWYYLFPKNPYTVKLIKAVKDLQDPDGGGFYAGLYEENEEINAILTGNTNGLILQILYYKALGNQPVLDVLEN
ncbi:DUF3131 domain-containing protein [Leptothoe sp. PORK10 BA2]|uniref:DUF3131 domain-containing protein n=1 Tax=Leptothoe sp. PORK10 BA2 TaxID=3110254 RepID=UPI002B21F403|nr:DUF3131 domain-containing protein [Leptothoe sp. PORK10 BA2]MEA5464816.1 DUF3131 domain-containing protein [Leptothoe sp. PORK10 BA2]